MPLIDRVEFSVVSGEAQVTCRVVFIDDNGEVINREIGDGRIVSVHKGDTFQVNFDGVDKRVRRTHPVEDIQSVDNIPEGRKKPLIRKIKI